MLTLPRVIASALIARRFSSRAISFSSGAPFCTRRSRIVARSSTSPASVVAPHRPCGTSSQVPNLSASFSQGVECASRKRAAPRSQFNGVAARGDARAGQGPWRGQQAQSQWCWQQPRCLAYSRVVCGSETTAPGFAVKQRPNPSVNLTPCGSPRLAFISFWAKHGLPQGAGYLER